ncbi:MAG: hypothetical protein ACJA01_004522 [Saprospiraceae bacterium]|jgi:hypothetical protein
MNFFYILKDLYIIGVISVSGKGRILREFKNSFRIRLTYSFNGLLAESPSCEQMGTVKVKTVKYGS